MRLVTTAPCSQPNAVCVPDLRLPVSSSPSTDLVAQGDSSLSWMIGLGKRRRGQGFCLQVVRLVIRWQHIPWLPVFRHALQELVVDTAPVAVTSSRRFSSTLARVAGTAEHLRSISLSGKHFWGGSCARACALRQLECRAVHACLLYRL